jgi:hypothetical protein
MHHKLTKHGRFCKQNNQLPTKSHDELKDNSNMVIIFEKIVCLNSNDTSIQEYEVDIKTQQVKPKTQQFELNSKTMAPIFQPNKSKNYNL